MQGTSSDYPDRRRIQLAWFGSNRSAISSRLDDCQPTSARVKVCHKGPGILPDQIDRCTSPSEHDRRIAARSRREQLLKLSTVLTLTQPGRWLTFGVLGPSPSRARERRAE